MSEIPHGNREIVVVLHDRAWELTRPIPASVLAALEALPQSPAREPEETDGEYYWRLMTVLNAPTTAELVVGNETEAKQAVIDDLRQWANPATAGDDHLDTLALLERIHRPAAWEFRRWRRKQAKQAIQEAEDFSPEPAGDGGGNGD